jgi:antitoxin (DNA-binding transcriptional repressor) of toxin-antitoxin stability system
MQILITKSGKAVSKLAPIQSDDEDHEDVEMTERPQAPANKIPPSKNLNQKGNEGQY